MMQLLLLVGRETVKEKLQRFLDQTQVDEIMITSHIYDPHARLNSYKIVSDVWKEKELKNKINLFYNLIQFIFPINVAI